MLHRFNAQVVALSRTEKDLQSLQEEIGCETIIAELGNPEEARRAAEKAGEIDFLVNKISESILFSTRSGERYDSAFKFKGRTDNDNG